MSLPVRPSFLNPALLFTAAPQLPLQPAAGSLLLAECLPAMVTLPRRDANGQVPKDAQRFVHSLTLGRGVVYDVEIEAPATVGRPTAGTWDFLIALEGLAVEGRFDLDTGLLSGKPLTEHQWLRLAGRSSRSTSASRQLRAELRRLQKTTITVTNRSTVAALARSEELGTAYFAGRVSLDRGEWILSYGRSVELDENQAPLILHELRINPTWLQSMANGLTYFLDTDVFLKLRSFYGKRLLQFMAVEFSRGRLDHNEAWVVDEATLCQHLGLADAPLFRVRGPLADALTELERNGAVEAVEELDGAGSGRGARPGGRLLAIRPALASRANGLLAGVTLEELRDREWLMLYAHLRAMGFHATQAREVLDTMPRLRVRTTLQLMFWFDSKGSAPSHSWGARLRHAFEHPAMCDEPSYLRWRQQMYGTDTPAIAPRLLPAVYGAPATSALIPRAERVEAAMPPTLTPDALPDWAQEIVESVTLPSIARTMLRNAKWIRSDDGQVTVECSNLSALLTEHRQAVESAVESAFGAGTEWVTVASHARLV